MRHINQPTNPHSPYCLLLLFVFAKPKNSPHMTFDASEKKEEQCLVNKDKQ